MKTLVIIDDEFFFRKSIINLFKDSDKYMVIGEAKNGKEGIDIIRNLHPDIALVDISMPLMDGMEMIRSLYENCSTKFILSTGYSDFEYAKAAISFHVKDYLLKPLNTQELLHCLDKLSGEIDSEKRKENAINDYYLQKKYYRKLSVSNNDCQQILLMLRHQKENDLRRFLTDRFEHLKKQDCPVQKIQTTAFFYIEILDEYLAEFDHKNIDFPEIPAAINKCTACENAEQFQDLILRTYISVLDKLNKYSSKGKSNLIEEVQDYIAANYMTPDLRLDTIAKHFFVSAQHLSTLFSREKDITLSSYITNYRMQKAKELFLKDAPSIQNAAVLCGFTDAGYFSKCFKKYYGVSPKEFMSTHGI